MRQDEEFCQKQFDIYIKSKSSPNTISWVEGNHKVAPDYFLTVGNESFVVEVTTLMEQVPRGKKRISAQGIYEFTREYVEKLETAALQKKILTGTYFIHFSPIQIDVHNVRRKLKNKILEFIAETQNIDKTEPMRITVDEIRYCSVQKIRGVDTKLILASYPASAKWQGDAQIEACRDLNEIVSNKSKLLEHIESEKILLVLIRSPFVEIDYLLNCIAQIENIQNFHTIFAVGGWENSNRIIFTKNQLWL